MCLFTVGKDYCLRLPDGRTLGHVHVARLVDAWAEGPFTPSADFEEFRAIFERESRLRHRQIIPLWEEAADAARQAGVDALNLRVHVPGVTREQAREQIVRLGDEVLPGLRASTS